MTTRVLQVIPRAEIGGVQTHVADLSTGLVALGVQVVAVTGHDGPLVARLRAVGVPVAIVPMRRRSDVAAIWRLVRIIRQINSDIVHTHGPLAGVLGRCAALLAGRPRVHTLHGLGILDELARPQGRWHHLKLRTYQWQERWLNTRTDMVIAVSPAVGWAVVGSGHVPPDRLVVIPHGVALPAQTAPSSRPVALYVGRLHREKGVDDLLVAFARVRERVADAVLRIVGDGPQRGDLQAQIVALNMSASVEMVGESDGAAMMMRDVACFVLPSRAEGLSYALLEAMAQGIPCVATSVGGTPDVIADDTTGLLVRPGDVQGLANAITRVLTDQHKARLLGEAGRQRVAQEFSRDQMISSTLEIYRAVLERRSI